MNYLIILFIFIFNEIYKKKLSNIFLNSIRFNINIFIKLIIIIIIINKIIKEILEIFQGLY